MDKYLVVLLVAFFSAWHLVSGLDMSIIEQDLLRSPPDCEEGTELIILIHSKPDHYELRKTLRSTWATSHESLRHVFFVGRSISAAEKDLDDDEDVNARVLEESDTFHDIALIDMRDSYHNLTFKHAIGHKWAIEKCPKTAFVLKTDDDVFVDTIHLVYYLNSFKFKADTGFILCHLIEDQVPVRSRDELNGKWYLSHEDYAEETFPPYCSGSAYVTSLAAITRIQEVISEIAYLFVDDVFMTGLATRMLPNDVQIFDWSGSFLIQHMDDEKMLLDPESRFYSPLLMVAYDIPAEAIRVLFEKAKLCLRNVEKCYGILYSNSDTMKKYIPPKLDRMRSSRTEL